MSKQPVNNPYTVEDYATGFMCGLEDRGWTRLDRELEDDIREQVASLWEKLDVDGLEARIAELERERDEALKLETLLKRAYRAHAPDCIGLARFTWLCDCGANVWNSELKEAQP